MIVLDHSPAIDERCAEQFLARLSLFNCALIPDAFTTSFGAATNSPYPPSSTDTTRPSQHLEAADMMISVVHLVCVRVREKASTERELERERGENI